MQAIVNIGFGNYVIADRVIAVVNPKASPMRRLREDAKNEGRLIDATQGRKTKSFIILDSNHVILCAVTPDTVTQRFQRVLSGGGNDFHDGNLAEPE